MTNRIYYRDAEARSFHAKVVALDARDGRTLVRLDESAFYPTSGGQPFDTGTLADARVIDVFDDDESFAGDVVHVVEGGALAVGQEVQGAIDWARRFDHMQQHTGQHVLSAAFDRLLQVRTVSFHMGGDASTIDLDRTVSAEEIARAEREANRVVWENRPVSIRFVSEEEAARLPLRKPPKKSGVLRLVEVDRFDLSACGGTHVASTGAIGAVAVGGWERFKGGTRVEFLCGGRAVDRFHALRDTADRASRALSVSAAEVPQGIERLLEEVRDQRKAIAALESQVATCRAAELVAAAEPTPYGRLVARVVGEVVGKSVGNVVGKGVGISVGISGGASVGGSAGWAVGAASASGGADAAVLKALAVEVVAHAGLAVVLISASTPALVVVARSSDLTLHAGNIVKALTAAFGGRGGGKPDLAQAGGLNGDPATILAEARRLLATA